MLGHVMLEARGSKLCWALLFQSLLSFTLIPTTALYLSTVMTTRVKNALTYTARKLVSWVRILLKAYKYICGSQGLTCVSDKRP